MKKKITIAYGDGIGPEIMDATLNILNAAGAQLEYDVIEIGEKVYLQGISAGIKPEAWDSLRTNKVFLKSPITTPQGKGYKSLNVTTRKSLGLFANVRPCVAYHPYVDTMFPDLDLVIVRENEEDLYAGIEHRQTNDVYQCLKLVSRPGCEKIVRYAFEYARAYGRKKVTCMSKDNIMKLTDGLFHKIFDEIGAEYPDIQKEHHIIDIGSALIADTPERFDVIVTLNLYGDIISDIAAQVAGSVGLGGSANIGESCAMFEAIHGSAPDIAGKNIANPSGLINSAIMMLVHIGQNDIAEKIQNAWLRTLEDGIHTGDIYKDAISKVRAGTKEFAQAVIDRLGQKPQKFAVSTLRSGGSKTLQLQKFVRKKEKKQVLGVDVFLQWDAGSANDLGLKLEQLNGDGLKLKMISNRGVKVYPEGLPETFCTDHWRCRFVAETFNAENPDDLSSVKDVTHQQIVSLLNRVTASGLDFVKIETLCAFDGVKCYSLGQGE
ncbi:MAG: NADP-dependent isocitrate dehydrogenase [Bacteroidota bacterium]|jgi:isocitrate dehydrogenase